MSRIAAVFVLIGIVCLSVGVGLYDFRAGMIVFGVCVAASGIWNLSQE